jgi:hypothetical protein
MKTLANQRVDRTAAPPCSFEACRESLGVYCCRVTGLPAAVGHSYRSMAATPLHNKNW